MNSYRYLSALCSVCVLATSDLAVAQAEAVAGEAAPQATRDASPTTVTPTTQRRAESSAKSPISEREAIAQALQYNPSLRAAQLDVRSSKQAVRAEEGRYPYYFNAGAGYTHSTSTQLFADDTVASTSAETVDAGIGLRRTFPYGTQAEVRAEGQYFQYNRNAATTGAGVAADAGYAAVLRASVSQPLLRGYGKRITEAELRAARVSQTGSEKALVRTESALIGDVLSAYYELWYASRALEIEGESLELAQEQERQARERVGMGSISPVDLLTFQTQVAEREESVVAAELSRKQRSLSLSQLIGRLPLSSDLHASDVPALGDQPIQAAQVAKAMQQGSLELAELEQQVKLAQSRAEVSGENWRPELNLEGWAESAGVSENVGGAWSRAARGSYWSAHVGISFDLPLDDAARNAEEMQAQLAVQSAKEQLAAARTRIASDAEGAVAGERAARETLASAERTTALAESSYMAQDELYKAGQTIAIEVQVADAALRRARLREARARVDAVQARLILLHLTGQLTGGASPT